MVDDTISPDPDAEDREDREEGHQVEERSGSDVPDGAEQLRDEDRSPSGPGVEAESLQDTPEEAELLDAESVYWAEPPLDVHEPALGTADGEQDVEGTQGDSVPEAEHAGAAAEPTDTEKQPSSDESLEIDMGPQHRSRWWVWALIGLAVAVVAGGATYGWWWMTAREIVVPDLVGRQAAEATQALNDVSLTLGDVSEVPTDVAPVGVVISQKPEAGSRLKPNEEVSFVLAAAPEYTEVPNVVGLSLEDAAILLAKARLRPAEVRSYSATTAAGFVIAQVPARGIELMPGNPVALAVSKGPAPGNTTVPAVTGLAQGDAVALIGTRGLTARVYQSLDPSVGAGLVVTQTPLPGTTLAPSSSVQLLVSKGFGSGSVAVPDVVNDTRKEAVAAVRAAGLKPAVVFEFHPTAARGTVISQMPFGGRRVQSGDSVGLLVSKGPLTTGLVPSVVGSASAEATAAVSNAGFRAVTIEVEMPGRQAGVVVGQFPPPSTTYELRYPVICLVAKEITP